MSKKCLIVAFLIVLSSIVLVQGVMAEGEIEIIGPKINAGTGIRKTCGNNITSCGESGKCVDLTGLVYCVRGRIVATKCLSNNIRNETLTSSCDGGSFRIKIINSNGGSAGANITVYAKDSANIIGRTSVQDEGFINTLDGLADVDFDTYSSEFNFLIKNVDFTGMDQSNSTFMIDRVQATIPGTLVFKTFYVQLPNNFTHAKILLKIKYSDISIDENNITLYKCSDFNISSHTCNGNWTIVPIIKDSVNKVVIAEVDSFSAYSLGDSGSTTTTTTTTTTTVPTTTTTTTTTIPQTTTTTIYQSSGGTSTTTTTTIPEVEETEETEEVLEETTTTSETTSTTSAVNESSENANSGSAMDSITAFFAEPANYTLIGLPLATAASIFVMNYTRKNGREYYSGQSYGRSKQSGKRGRKGKSALILNL